MKILAMLYLFVIIFLTMFGILNIDLNNFNLDDIFMIKVILILLLLSDFYLGRLNLKNAKNLKMISEESLPVAWHPNRW